MYQRVGKAAYKADLNNTLALDKHFNHPHKQFKTIHIAGTNGKGSISHMLCSILMEAGYKVGLYTSPHLVDFRERIRINGKPIAENDVVNFVSKSAHVFEIVKPSFFEMTVALAFKYFADQSVDVAVIEVGLGGRLDSTNIITPDISVITNIGLDHTELLGSSLEKIATEKAGIIKPNVPVVISEWKNETKPIFHEKAKECRAKIIFASEQFKATSSYLGNGYQNISIKETNSGNTTSYSLDLLGNYQKKNLVGVLSSVNELKNIGYNISSTNIEDGLKKVIHNTGLLGRWQVLSKQPLTICDTGHNLEGMLEIVEQLRNTPHNKLHMVIGMVGDKNIDGVLNILPKNATYYFTRPSIPRALDEVKLTDKAHIAGLKGYNYVNVKLALNAARIAAQDDDLIFIGGSTFVVADALSSL